MTTAAAPGPPPSEPPDVPTAAQTSAFYVTGGTLGAEAASYVERQADQDLLHALTQGDYCYVLNSRQMGKSSLCVRTIGRLKEQGTRTCFLDLTKFGGKNLAPEQWYAALLSEVGRTLGLRAEMLDFWKQNADLGPMQRLFGAIQQVALPADPSPLVVFVDEIDVTRGLPFSADEFFASIRQCYVGRATDPMLSRLRFCLLGTATPADLIQDTRTSPFNIGRRIEVKDFTPAEAAPLAHGLGPDGPALLSRVLFWTGGHPYLTQRLCRAAQDAKAARAADIDGLCSGLFLTRSATEADDNLAFVRNRLVKSEVDLAGLLDLYGQMRRGRRVPDDEADPLCAVLKLSGVARVEAGGLRVRNRIYERVFSREWIVEHTPGAELRRQREAYRSGLLRAGGIAACVLLAMAILAVSALQNAKRADRAAFERRDAFDSLTFFRADDESFRYTADMDIIQQEWENNRVGYVLDLLQETRNSHWRGFEWGYWNRLCHSNLITIQGHIGILGFAVFSPDGRRILTTGNENNQLLQNVATVKVWDAQTGRELLTLKGLTGPVNAASFSPDGQRILTISNENRVKTVKVWDAQTGRELLTLKEHTGPVNAAVFSPHGQRILTTSNDGTARIWDAQTGRELLTLKGHTDYVHAASFSPDGQRILTASNDGTARIWDVQTGRELLTLKGHTGPVHAASFSPDGQRILTASDDGTARIWDAQEGHSQFTEQGPIMWTVFSPDGRRILTVSVRGIARIWDAQTGGERLTLKGHTGPVNAASFSPDGQRILTTGNENNQLLQNVATVKVWDAQTGRELLTLKGLTGPVNAASFSPDGQRILTISNENRVKTVKVWDAQTGRELLTLKGHTGPVNAAVFSPHGQRILTVSNDGTARIWDAQTGRKLLTFQGLRGPMPQAAFSPNSDYIITTSDENNVATVKIWDVQTGQELRTLEGLTGPVLQAVFFPDGQRILTISNENRVKTVKVWDTHTGRERLTLKEHTGPVNAAVFSPDSQRILTTSNDGTVKLWFTDFKDYRSTDFKAYR